MGDKKPHRQGSTSAPRDSVFVDAVDAVRAAHAAHSVPAEPREPGITGRRIRGILHPSTRHATRAVIDMIDQQKRTCLLTHCTLGCLCVDIQLVSLEYHKGRHYSIAVLLHGCHHNVL